MPPLRIYNSLTRQVETFEPIDPDGKRVLFYSCGPTVYDYAHIGNFRSFLNADVMRRTLELLGYEVRHVMNMTDVGHMTEDDDEDRMEVASRRLAEAKKSGQLPPDVTDIDPSDPYAIADFYAQAFIADAKRLGLTVVHDADEHPELLPRPTRYIPQMIEMVETLISKEHAYVASDDAVYFDVRSFPEYGRLSGNSLDQLREAAGGRVSSATQSVKRHPADFLLWKPDGQHLMRWPSPWGEGYPGWHLECSVMAQSLLAAATGGEIDIHSGGEDNIFPHHECEIAQSCSATDAPAFARYWFHTRHLNVEGDKMSKSKGNFYTLADLVARGASPAAVRLELTKTHYRSNANFTFQGLKDSQGRIERWSRLERRLAGGATPYDGGTPLADSLPAFTEALADDLNIARAIGVLDEAVGRYGGEGEETVGAPVAVEVEALRTMMHTLGVHGLEQEASGGVDEAWIEAKIREREAARQSKDWAASDVIRDELAEAGIAVKDGPEGTKWKRMVQ